MGGQQGQNDRERMQGTGGVSSNTGRDQDSSLDRDLNRSSGGVGQRQDDQAINRGAGIDRDIESDDLSTPKNTDWNPQADKSRDRNV